MKLSTIQIVGLGLIGGFLLLQATQANANTNPQFRNLPPRPNPYTDPARFQLWVNAIMSSVSDISSLFQPGGPFENLFSGPNDDQLIDLLDPDLQGPGQNPYQDYA